MKQLLLFNRQKSRPLSLALLRRMARRILEDLRACRKYELGVHLIGYSEMRKLNETFLGHAGSTDVITFDHNDDAGDGNPPGRAPRPAFPSPPISVSLHGEIFISVDDAVAQAGRFRATWQAEIVRYLAHGILHLEGYNDTEPTARRTMKRAENRLVLELSQRFDFDKLDRAKNGCKSK
ncbi:MAG: rRNA maturation RNase YbeY [Verrucomicrobiota bacterium]|jgi:probable rRNA maturation factor